MGINLLPVGQHAIVLRCATDQSLGFSTEMLIRVHLVPFQDGKAFTTIVVKLRRICKPARTSKTTAPSGREGTFNEAVVVCDSAYADDSFSSESGHGDSRPTCNRSVV